MKKFKSFILPVICILVAQLLLLLFVVFFVNPIPQVLSSHSVVSTFFQNGQSLLEGKIPYRDFSLEYPPLSLFPMIIPFIFKTTTLEEYHFYFALFNILLSLSITVVISIICKDRTSFWTKLSPLVYYTILIVLVSPIALWRFDLFPAFLTLIACLMLFKKRSFFSGIFLGLGFAAKIYPILLVPLFIIFLYVQSTKINIFRFLLGICLSTFLIFAPIVLLYHANINTFLQYQTQRGLQIETTYSAFANLISRLGWISFSYHFGYGAYDADFPGDSLIASLSTILFGILFIVYNVFLFFKLKQMPKHYLPDIVLFGSLAILIIFIVVNKVFSPQFLIWLLPFFAFAPGYLFAIIFATLLTMLLIYPFLYNDLLTGHLLPLILLNFRNLLMIILLFLVLRIIGKFKRREAFYSSEKFTSDI